MEDHEEVIEKEKLALEKDKLRVERFKAWWTGASVLGSVLIAASTFGFGVWSQHQTAQAQFEIKAAEIALNTENPSATKNKSEVLAQLFPKRLPPEFGKQFNPDQFSEPDPEADIASKKELLKLLAEKPERRAQIIKDWKALFPDDKWVTDLKHFYM